MADRSQYLQGVVDMGSNGIRFSISDLSPPLTRLLPTLYQSRAAISLYDAQFPATSVERIPIPTDIIEAIVGHFLRFQTICTSFSVSPSNIAVLATEATRTAPNSAAFLAAIKASTGWDVTLLSKEDEARLGAAGIRSSLGKVDGLVMDLGGGSTQLTYVSPAFPAGKGGRSMPYGAAALSRRLADAEREGRVDDLAKEIRAAITDAYQSLELDKSQLGQTLYLSGGGFRGWGHVLMSSHKIQPYPIAVVNGFSAKREEFLDTENVMATVAEAQQGDGIHRVSARRAGQVPAVAFLVQQLASVIKSVEQVRFCQGGVREGFLFDRLPISTQNLYPLTVAAGPHNESILALLDHATAPTRTFPPQMLRALAALLYAQDGVSVDVRTATALRHTTTGAMAGVHGLAHDERAMLAILLANRHGGRKDLPHSERQFYDSLAGLLTDEQHWWARYLGVKASMIANVHPCAPAGNDARLAIAASFGGPTVFVRAIVQRDWAQTIQDDLERLQKLGKKKHWVNGWGYKVVAEVQTL